jgi:S1-C subfamily serine protease
MTRDIRPHTIFLAIAAWMTLASPASAEVSKEIIDKVSSSIVHITATGTSTKDNTERTSEGTGFYVSSDGFILTNYHLLAPLDDVFSDTIVINVGKGPKSLSRIKVLPVQGNEIADLLVLKAPENEDPYTPPPLEFADEPEVSEKLYTLGFPNVSDPDFDGAIKFAEGVLSSRSGPTASVWETNIGARAGQSGSPVFNSSGAVVGILKGVEKSADQTVSYYIPIKFADPLLPQLRVAQLRRDLELVLKALGGAEKEPEPLNGRLKSVEGNINNLRRIFNWKVELVGDDLRVDFSKMVAGEPKLKAIRPQVTPYGQPAGGGPLKKGSTLRLIEVDRNLPQPANEPYEVPVSGIDTEFSSGFFIVPRIGAKIKERMNSDGEISAIPLLSVRIIPVLEKDGELAPQIFEVRVATE